VRDLSSVKVGDKVEYRTWESRDERFIEVTRITASQIICGEQRFRKSDGREINGAKHYLHSDPSISGPCTNEQIDAYRRYQAAGKIRRHELELLTLDQLTTISKWLEEAKAQA
jgi:hypothetical protein